MPEATIQPTANILKSCELVNPFSRFPNFYLVKLLNLASDLPLHTPFYDASIRLGLTKDEDELHDERIKLWNEFDTCCLDVLQKQKNITQKIIDLGQPPLPPQSYLQKTFLEKMGRELVRL